MTTSEIIASVKALHGVVESAREQTEKAGKNSSWLLVARGAFAKAIEQLGLHQRNNEEAAVPTEVNKGSAAGAAGPSVSALTPPRQPCPTPVDSLPAKASTTEAETEALRAAK
jgi:hypothetical protein